MAFPYNVVLVAWFCTMVSAHAIATAELHAHVLQQLLHTRPMTSGTSTSTGLKPGVFLTDSLRQQETVHNSRGAFGGYLQAAQGGASKALFLMPDVMLSYLAVWGPAQLFNFAVVSRTSNLRDC